MFFTSIKSKLNKAVFFTLCLVSSWAKAQIEQNNRIELKVASDREAFSILPLDSSGILLYRFYLGPIGSTKDQVEVMKLDTALQVQWRGFMGVPKGNSLASVSMLEQKIYFFFKPPQGQLGFLLYTLSPKDGSYVALPLNNVVSFNATEFVAGNETFLIGGYFNFRPIVLWYSLKTGLSKLLPGFLNEQGEITQMKTYPGGNVDVVVSAKNSSRRKCIWIRSFNNEGDLIKTVVVEPEERKNLIFGRAAKMVNDNQIIAGVYGRNTQYARGIFVADVNPFGEYAIHYYNFADLRNFFHYMKAKREKRVKERIERRRIKGKKVKFNYRFLVHELIPYQDQYIMLGEAFYASYTNARANPLGVANYGNVYSPWTYGISNRIGSTPYQNNFVFDGFQYTHAVALGFDKDAKLIWDNSFEINGIKSFQLEQFVKILPGKDHIVLVYMFENLIRTKIIKGEQVIEGTMQNPMKALEGEEIVKNSTRTSKVDYWYGNHFLVYGIQAVKSGNTELRVFFINKLSAH
ncbi:hypothetical protein WSM22_23430 [Cytophagales bacterium WSM2-2]|nr:hypothetical protein WSM22_23430 [Cytophagales bacterium WSM2-2]